MEEQKRPEQQTGMEEQHELTIEEMHEEATAFIKRFSETHIDAVVMMGDRKQWAISASLNSYDRFGDMLVMSMKKYDGMMMAVLTAVARFFPEEMTHTLAYVEPLGKEDGE